MSIRKSLAGTKVMVVSPHALASAAGARILASGGNAFDAAVAVSACLAVVYPHMTGLGGDSFWLMFHPGDGAVRGYNGSGRSGRNARREAFAECAAIPARGARSAITVPGMVDSWAELHREYGRLPFAQLLEPAIGHAAGGFPLSQSQHAHTKRQRDLLSAMPVTADIYLPGGTVPHPGDRFVQKRLADTLRLVAEGGKEVFYKGEIARRIVRYLGERGGLLTEDDFADHAGEWTEPVSTTYKDYEVYQHPPNSQGFTALMVLNVLKMFDFKAIRHGSFDYVHLLTEAVKLSFRDRDRYLSDPDFAKVPLDMLLSDDYAGRLAASIDMSKAGPGHARPMGGDTAYAAVVDEEGNAVSFIQSLYYEFGSAVTAGDTGVLMQNRGSFFSLVPGHVNTLQPNKRTFHTLMPAIACKNGKPSLLYGTMGGEGQPQTQTAIFTRIVEYGMDPQIAVNEPRWVWGRTWGAATDELQAESRLRPSVVAALEKAGHRVKLLAPFDDTVGHAHVIRIEPSGRKRGAADPRSDGKAYGW